MNRERDRDWTCHSTRGHRQCSKERSPYRPWWRWEKGDDSWWNLVITVPSPFIPTKYQVHSPQASPGKTTYLSTIWKCVGCDFMIHSRGKSVKKIYSFAELCVYIWYIGEKAYTKICVEKNKTNTYIYICITYNIWKIYNCTFCTLMHSWIFTLIFWRYKILMRI